MQRCLRCQGSKKIAPMGGIYIQCTECNGIGFVESQPIKVTCEHIVTEVEPNIFKVELTNEAPITIENGSMKIEPMEQPIIKRRGRPKGLTKQQGAM